MDGERAGSSRSFALPACPDEPAYPPTHGMLDILRHWPPDDTVIPPRHHGGICRFDYARDYDKALRYRQADVPFVLTGHSGLAAVARRWTEENFAHLTAALGPEREYRLDVSASNFFQNYEHPLPEGWVPPFNSTRAALGDFLEAAMKPVATRQRDEPHRYLRFSGEDAAVVREDLGFLFDLGQQDPLLMDTPPVPERVRCRWGGAAGIVTAPHFDGYRNIVALVSGKRRWILAPPGECAHCYVIHGEDRPDLAPYYRHCEVDWRRPDLARHPRFQDMRGLELVLHPGEMLFVPSFWLHQIVHLEPMSLQCNAFSSVVSPRGREDLATCGFPVEELGDEEREEAAPFGREEKHEGAWAVAL